MHRIGHYQSRAPHAIERRKIVWVDDNGKQHVIEDDTHGPLPAVVAHAASGGGQKSVERHKLI